MKLELVIFHACPKMMHTNASHATDFAHQLLLCAITLW